VVQDQIKVELDEDNLLHIDVEANTQVRDESDREGWKFHHVERSSSAQHRSLKLPQNVDASGISAVSENGVLKVTIPKTVTQAESRRRITIS
jgi:HSP20 family protein